jgi:hypothetical protein
MKRKEPLTPTLSPLRGARGTEAAFLATLVFLLFSAPAWAAEPAPARIRVTAALLDEVVQSALPVTVSLTRDLTEGGGKMATLTELRYCGAGGKGSGLFRAAGRLGAAEPKPRLVLPAVEPCRQSLAELAPNIKPALADASILVDIEASWNPWELKLQAVRVLVIGKDGRSRLAMDKKLDLVAIASADLRIETTAGTPIVLAAMPVFQSGAVEIAIVLADKAPTKPPHLDSAGRDAAMPTQANAVADIPTEFTNQVLRHLTWNAPLTIPAEREEIDIQNVALAAEGAGENARLTLTGSATPRTVRETMRFNLAAAGEPLRVSLLQATSGQIEDCSGLSTMAALGCNVRNGARGTGAEAFGRALTRQLGGRFVHELLSPLALRFTVAGQRIELRGDLVRTSGGPRGLQVAGQLSAIDRRSPAAE